MSWSFPSSASLCEAVVVIRALSKINISLYLTPSSQPPSKLLNLFRKFNASPWKAETFDRALCGGKGCCWGHECKASDVWTLSSPCAKNLFFDFLFPTLLWWCCQETLQMSKPLSVTGKQALNWTFILLSNLLHSKEKATLPAWKWPFGNHWLLKVNYLKLRYMCICIYPLPKFSLIFICTYPNKHADFFFVCLHTFIIINYRSKWLKTLFPLQLHWGI